MSWDSRWMELAKHIASWSKDKSTKVGAVIVNDANRVVSLGWNGFPRGVNDDVMERHDRPAKYLYTEHAERNAIYNAAAIGTVLSQCSIYLPWFPCADCARAIIQSGISTVICVKPETNEKWDDSFKASLEMLTEAKVEIRYVA